MWQRLVLFVCSFFVYIRCQFYECHDDPAYNPEEGVINELQFTWLGILQYIHVKKGTPYYFKTPRVVLVSKQFVLTTATDAANLPTGYALGNVVFGDYERDESECKITIKDMSEGAVCDPAVLLMPIADVLLHPEFKHFNSKFSLALLKMITPVQSKYVLPVCLPLNDFLIDQTGTQTQEKFYHVDFTEVVPRAFMDEEKEVVKVNWLPRELCFLYDNPKNKSSDLPQDRIACTTGCNFNSGAPILIHEHTGHWTLVALSQGGAPCPDPLRSKRPPPPPLHILIQPYVPWITSAITGKAMGAMNKDDPFGYAVPRASSTQLLGHGWDGHWWHGGLRCYDRGEAAKDMTRFYQEVFNVRPIVETYMTYHLELASAKDMRIVCVKVGMPYQMSTPHVHDLDSTNVKVSVPTIRLLHSYRIMVEGWATRSPTNN